MQPRFSDKHNTLKLLDNFSLGQSDLPICKFSILQWLSSYPNTRTLKNLFPQELPYQHENLRGTLLLATLFY